jgi:hypothetical protein
MKHEQTQDAPTAKVTVLRIMLFFCSKNVHEIAVGAEQCQLITYHFRNKQIKYLIFNFKLRVG